MPWRKRKRGTTKQRGKAFKVKDTGGYPRRVIWLKSKIPKTWKKVSNRELLYGDFDGDKIPNVDDL